MESTANHPVRTTEKTLAIVETLRELESARLYELDEELDMTKGAIHNHLSTLREHGYVSKNDNQYELSLKFLTLGGHVRAQHPLYQFGRPKARQLANQTGLLVNLMKEENGRGVYLFQARGEEAVNLDTHVGYRIRLHHIAVGKAILAYLPRERIDEIVERWGLPAVTGNTITEKPELLEELEQIRERGYATDVGERTEGLCCIGAPVLVDDEPLGAISVSAPTSRLEGHGFDDEMTSEVKSTADAIALDIRYM